MNPSKRRNLNPHVTPECQGCRWENEADPIARACSECIRSELIKLGERANDKWRTDCWTPK